MSRQLMTCMVLGAVLFTACPDREEDRTRADAGTAMVTAKVDETARRTRAPETARSDAGDGDRSGGRPAAEAEDGLAVEVRRESYETFVGVHLMDAEKPALDFRPRGRSLRIEWDRSRPSADQIDAVAAMVDRLKRDYPEEMAQPKLLIALDYISYADFVQRLARHASADPAWTGKKSAARGEPRTGNLHRYIVEAANGERLFRELDEIFSRAGLGLELDGVEKCSVARPGSKGEMGRWLSSVGVKSGVKLPMGCLMGWFRLEKLVESAP